MADEPVLTNRIIEPKGVIGKNQKVLIYLAAVLLVTFALFTSSLHKKPIPANTASVPLAVADTGQETTAANQKDLRSTLAQERAEQPAPLPLPAGTAAQQAAAAQYSQTGAPLPAGSGTASTGQPQPTPAQQQEQQLAARERERQYAARYESNLVYTAATKQAEDRPQTGQGAATQSPSTLTPGREAGEAPTATYKRGQEVQIDSAVGQPYVVYEGLTLDTVLMNRLDGDAAGPVKVLVSNPVYSHDHQHVLIPDGTVVLGEAKKIGNTGFGQQRRIAVAFHRMIMPDGYSVDLDQFHGLDQIGEEGLRDKVNNHYLQIFGTSIALGVIAGAAQITQGGTGYNASGSQAFVSGASAGISQQATTIMDRFIQIPPTITIREGHRVKLYFTQDLLLPAYENHRIPQTF